MSQETAFINSDGKLYIKKNLWIEIGGSFKIPDIPDIPELQYNNLDYILVNRIVAFIFILYIYNKLDKDVIIRIISSGLGNSEV